MRISIKIFIVIFFIDDVRWILSFLSVHQATLNEKDGALTRVDLDLRKAQVKADSFIRT